MAKNCGWSGADNIKTLLTSDKILGGQCITSSNAPNELHLVNICSENGGEIEELGIMVTTSWCTSYDLLVAGGMT